MKTISNTAFHSEKIRSDPDYFCKDESIAAATGPAVLVEKQLGNIQSGVEIIVEVEDAITATATGLQVNISRAATAGGARTVVFAFPAVTSTTRASGVVLGTWVPPNNDDGFYSVTFTSAVGNSGSINAFQHPIPR